MNEPKHVVGSKRTRWITLRVNEEEHKDIMARFKGTTCVKLSDYVRRMIFQQPVVVRYRDGSMDDFMEELILLRVELNSLGNNFNQVVRKLNSVKELGRFAAWAQVAESYQKELLGKIEIIQEKINAFSKQWLQI